MNSDLVNFIEIDHVISLILEFLFGSVIELNRNIEALNLRLVCKKFRQVFDRLVNLSLDVSIRNSCCQLSDISSISIYSGYEITEQDWKNAFGDKLSNLESKLEYLHIEAGSIEYIPKFTCLESILWEVSSGCYDLLKEIPHNDLIITGYITCYGSITHLTRLSEIEINLCDSDHKLIDKHLPSTILRMTINMYSEVTDVIDLSKFRSLEYLEIVECYEVMEYLIEELILPPSLHEFYSEVKIKKMNLDECERLKVLELKFTHKWDITIPYLPNLCDLRVDSFGGSYLIDTRTLMRIESLTVGVSPQRDTQWSVEFDGLDSYIKTNYAISLIPVCRNLVELAMEFNNNVERNDNYDIKDLVIILDIKNEYLNCITGDGFGGIAVTIKSHRQIECIDIDTDELNVIHEQKK